MKSHLLFLFNVILLARLFFQFSEKPLDWRRLAGLLFVELAGLLCFTVNWTWFSLLISLVLVHILFYRLEQKQQHINLLRLMSQGFLLLLVLLHNTNYFHLHLNQTIQSAVDRALSSFLPVVYTGNLTHFHLQATLFGALLLFNEANQLIRLFFGRFDLKPQAPDATPDNREYAAGRIIGILEREIVFIAVLSNHIAAIAYLLAAKGLARFKELDQRRYAEYFLIGTLLSTLIATLVAIFIRFLLRLN